MIKQATQRQQRVSQRSPAKLQPQAFTARAVVRIQQLEYRLTENIRSRLSEQRERFGNAVTHLEAVEQLAAGARYTQVSDDNERQGAEKIKQSKAGDMTTRLEDGQLESEVNQQCRARNPLHPLHRDVGFRLRLSQPTRYAG